MPNSQKYWQLYSRILKQIKEAVRLRQYIVTLHAVEEMDDDGFSIFDVEHCILNGVIAERQKELKTAEWKYLVQGITFDERGICVVAKMSITGKLVIITVYALQSKGER
jgi:hypothetical protein